MLQNMWVAYDISRWLFHWTSRQSSFARAQSWVQELQRQANPHLTIAFVGNKIDTEKSYRDVSTEEADSYAKEFDLLYFETSARVGTNVHHVFTEIGKWADIFISTSRMPLTQLSCCINVAKHIPLEQAQMSSSTASGKRTMNLKERQNSDRMNSCAC